MTAAADHARRSYDAFASDYDAFTADHDYASWTADIERVARELGLRGRRLLDVACGTGKSFLPMLDRGYAVTACDLSPAMAALAAEKAGGRVEVAVHDLRALPVLGAFDLITCLDDAVNYVAPEELVAAFAGLERNLADGGLAVFDLNSLHAYDAYYAAISVVLPDDDRVLVWRGRTPAPLPPGGLATADFEALRRVEGMWTSVVHRHRQRHHPAPVVRDALVAAGLQPLRVLGMHIDGSFTDGFDERRNTKALYLVGRA
jgi:SAM-dependent methyltransferase